MTGTYHGIVIDLIQVAMDDDFPIVDALNSSFFFK